jgi:hypothetical protein
LKQLIFPAPRAADFISIDRPGRYLLLGFGFINGQRLDESSP